MKQVLAWTGACAFLLATAVAAAAAEETKGTIKSVDTARREVIIKGVVSDTIYELNKNATVWLDGARCKLSDLGANDRAVIVYEKNGDHFMASQVRGLRKAQEATGTVNDVFKDKNEITLKGTIKNTTYELNKDATVWVDGKRGALTDIHTGDQVLITYQQRGDHWMADDVTVLKHN